MEVIMVVRRFLLVLGLIAIILSFVGALIMSNSYNKADDKFAKKLYKILFFLGTSFIIIAALLHAHI